MVGALHLVDCQWMKLAEVDEQGFAYFCKVCGNLARSSSSRRSCRVNRARPVRSAVRSDPVRVEPLDEVYPGRWNCVFKGKVVEGRSVGCGCARSKGRDLPVFECGEFGLCSPALGAAGVVGCNSCSKYAPGVGGKKAGAFFVK